MAGGRELGQRTGAGRQRQTRGREFEDRKAGNGKLRNKITLLYLAPCGAHQSHVWEVGLVGGAYICGFPGFGFLRQIRFKLFRTVRYQDSERGMAWCLKT